MENTNERNYIKEIIKLINISDLATFREEFLSYHPFELSEAFNYFNEDQRKKVYNSLSPSEIAMIFEHIDDNVVIELFEEMNSIFISHILQEMNIDETVDILKEINDKDKVASYLSVMSKDIAGEIRRLIQYEEETAGSIMTTDFISVNIDYSVKDAMKSLINEATNAETIYIIYITDADQKLVGVISLKELILARGHEYIKDIMNDKVISVLASTDQEEVAHIIRDYDFLAVPVVDYQNHILGMITIDDIVDVIDEEAGEDYEKLAAVPDIDDMSANNVLQNAYLRLPWLLLLLVLGMLNATLIESYESTLNKMVSLSFYLPLIAGIAGNTGTQSLAITVRSIATEDLSSKDKIVHIIKESSTGLIIGVVASLFALMLILVKVSFSSGDPIFSTSNLILAILVAVSILISLIVATFTGSAIPLIMEKLKVDPAVASGPFITTINDLISMTIYLGLATWAFSQFMP